MMRVFVMLTALVSGCSYSASTKEAVEAANVSRAALVEVRQIRSDLEVMRADFKKGEATLKNNQSRLTTDLRSVIDRLDKISASLQSALGPPAAIDIPSSTRVP